jgi:hypothetical protein
VRWHATAPMMAEGVAVAAAAAADGDVMEDDATQDATPSRLREVQPDPLYRYRTNKAPGG